jgi:hypothetical protein
VVESRRKIPGLAFFAGSGFFFHSGKVLAVCRGKHNAGKTVGEIAVKTLDK